MQEYGGKDKIAISRHKDNKYIAGFKEDKIIWTKHLKSAKAYDSHEEALLICEGIEKLYKIKSGLVRFKRNYQDCFMINVE